MNLEQITQKVAQIGRRNLGATYDSCYVSHLCHEVTEGEMKQTYTANVWHWNDGSFERHEVSAQTLELLPILMHNKLTQLSLPLV